MRGRGGIGGGGLADLARVNTRELTVNQIPLGLLHSFSSETCLKDYVYDGVGC